MEPLSNIHPATRENLVAMLDTLAARHRARETSDEEYSRTLNYLRFKIGEDLFDLYASPLAKEAALRVRMSGEARTTTRRDRLESR